ncbi:hypothetical protein [Mycoplasmopsis pullorum]|uniref:hypothetical protein n=1 Tax=Mycoplasmopsis pullorum TaxID=48003 RepID=UPI00111A0C8A|nr:hypothetical protein [Mycoplasmopsis pullorum]TNK82796.1 hypothetical protein C4M93_03520 [Mycoplasmopsis pullorum]TNK87991.1 hypothetical protein C4M89_03980 [Mycoplasmopsis pullorum]TNK91716.1 hypothetical protein C4M96_03665 [Mycoplasmopsis pullorum]
MSYNSENILSNVKEALNNLEIQYKELPLKNDTYYFENGNFLKTEFAIKFKYKNKVYNLFFYFAKEITSLNKRNRYIWILRNNIKPDPDFEDFNLWFPKIVQSVKRKHERIWWIFVQENPLSKDIKRKFSNVPDNIRVFDLENLDDKIKKHL